MCSDCEKVACAGVARWMTELRHCPGFDLTNALTGEVEVFPNFFERARLATIETKAELQDLTLALIEWREQTADLIWKQRSRGDLEWGVSATILDDVAEFGIAVFTKRLRK